MDRVENTILRNMIHDEDYLRKVVPFIQPDYFEDHKDRVIFEEVTKFVVKYDKPANQEILNIEIENRNDVTDTEFKEIIDLISTLNAEETNKDWLIDTTEKWCRDRAIYLALMKSIKIADGQDKDKGRDSIPSILSDALAVLSLIHI